MRLLGAVLFTFTLPDAFVASYVDRPVPWGYRDAAGTALGEIVFLRTYSRLKLDGSKETWTDVCRRVTEGTFTIQKDHAKRNRLPWSNAKAQRTAKDFFDRLWSLKWTPPGRGLWVMGTPIVMEKGNSAALQNCAFVSTADMTVDDPAGPFAFLMEASMLGIGVGFDTKGADRERVIHRPKAFSAAAVKYGFGTYVVPDSREGWGQSVRLLLESYLIAEKGAVAFDYSQIRPAGSPIKTFGGTAAGPEPLERLHVALEEILDARVGQALDSTTIADIGNLIGVCVVSGNVRRSAELLLGSIDDPDFLNLKDYRYEADGTLTGSAAARAGHGWMSNNSVAVNVGDDLTPVVEGIARNGEPGVVWMDLSRSHGRLVDPPNHRDHRAAGYNPCAEQTLESFECCTLVETYLNRAESLEDYKRTLKVAYLYAKTVTLLPTHWARTNAIMQRNRRIGTSMSGVADFVDRFGMTSLRVMMDEGYAEIQRLDRVYSEWLVCRESIKTTTVKPGGTVPLLAGASSGVHWTPGGKFFERAVRFGNDDPMVGLFRAAGYRVEVANESPETTVVVFFPIRSDAQRSEREVSIYEKANLAVFAQRWWSDNSVSVTLSFDPRTEADDVARVLAMHEGSLKTVSFLPMDDAGYTQMPYTQIDEESFYVATAALAQVDLSPIYAGDAADAVGEAYCSTDACEIKSLTAA